MRVLIIDDIHPYLKGRFAEWGWDCTDAPECSKAEIPNSIAEYDGLVLRTKLKIDKEFLELAPNLKFIARAGAGMENIDMVEAEARGIECVNSPEGNRDAVAEHALGMLLSLLNKLKQGDAQVRNGIWDREANWGTALWNKTVGIIGYGNTGEAFAQRLRGFNCKVIAYDKYKTGFGNDHVTEAGINTIHKGSDVISLHVPLTDETNGMISTEFFEQLQKPIYLINTARGKVVNTEALVAGLKNGSISGACLDVLEYEKQDFEDLFENDMPLPFQFLVESEKVILTPHVAGWTDAAYRKHSEVLVKKISALFR